MNFNIQFKIWRINLGKYLSFVYQINCNEGIVNTNKLVFWLDIGMRTFIASVLYHSGGDMNKMLLPSVSNQKVVLISEKFLRISFHNS